MVFENPTKVQEMVLTKYSLLQSFAVGVGCLALGYFLGKQNTILALSAAPDTVPYHGKEETHEVEELADKFEDFKMVCYEI